MLLLSHIELCYQLGNVSGPKTFSLGFYLCVLFLSEQDAGLDALSSIISRQKQMGQEIGNELDEQNGKSTSEIDQMCHLV